MSKVALYITISLDGFAAPLDDDLTRLHAWLDDPGPGQVVADEWRASGAVVMGRGMFDAGIPHWGPDPPFPMPVFVLTHAMSEPVVKGKARFTFVTDGIVSALGQAAAAAGDSRVTVMGGPSVAWQYLEAGLVDELHLVLAHVMLGTGRRLFGDAGPARELETLRVIEARGVTHLALRVVN